MENLYQMKSFFYWGLYAKTHRVSEPTRHATFFSPWRRHYQFYLFNRHPHSRAAHNKRPPAAKFTTGRYGNAPCNNTKTPKGAQLRNTRSQALATIQRPWRPLIFICSHMTARSPIPQHTSACRGVFFDKTSWQPMRSNFFSSWPRKPNEF